MAYFLSSKVTCIENYTPCHTYTFTGPDIFTSHEVSVTVKGPDLYKYHQGELIQNAFPYLSVEEREWMISGMLSWPEDWK